MKNTMPRRMNLSQAAMRKWNGRNCGAYRTMWSQRLADLATATGERCELCSPDGVVLAYAEASA
jgi:hypothetical protein